MKIDNKSFVLCILLLGAFAFIVGPISYFAYHSKKLEVEKVQIKEREKTARTEERCSHVPVLKKNKKKVDKQ